MNTNILQKILEELQKEKPSIDYIKGMVETLIAVQRPNSIQERVATSNYYTEPQFNNKIKSDEQETVPDFLKPGPKGVI